MERQRDSFFLSNKKQNKAEKAKPNFEKKDRQDHFNKNRPGFKQNDEKQTEKNTNEIEDKVKKPFDKKTYRLKKYSNKYKLEQWEEQRKKKLLRNYYKEIKNEPTAVTGTYKPKEFDEDVTDGNQEAGRFVRHPDLINGTKPDVVKKDPFWRAKEQYQKIKDEKLNKQQEIQKVKEEREAKLGEYKKKKQERFKKLSKKTKKGQPVMTGRLELLLEKIQKNK